MAAEKTYFPMGLAHAHYLGAPLLKKERSKSPNKNNRSRGGIGVGVGVVGER